MTASSGNPFPNRILSFFSRSSATSSPVNSHRPYDNLGLLAVLPEDREYSDTKHLLTSSSSTSKATRQIPIGSMTAHGTESVEEISISEPVRIPEVRNGLERVGSVVPVPARVRSPIQSPRVRVMVPPHEMVVACWGSHSVLEGVGRTLKGRDLRCTRDTVHRITGFLD